MKYKPLDKDKFLEKYALKNEYREEQISWEKIERIHKDYFENYYKKMQEKAEEFVRCLQTEKIQLSLQRDEQFYVHAIYGRAKDPEHLIAKIIRRICRDDISKYSEIDENNYREIIHDLIGIRVLVLEKEEWIHADFLIKECFGKVFGEEPVAYIRYGDRDVFRGRIKTDYSNKGYRSQHYICKKDDIYFEIQVRTLAEEVYGEFDHRVRYPYEEGNKFLIRYGSIVSKSVSQLDDMISLCFAITKENREGLDKQFEEDDYIDWNKKNEKAANSVKEQMQEESENAKELDMEKQEDILARTVFHRNRRS